MAIRIARIVVVPIWLLASALVVVFAAPSTMVAMGLLLSSGLAAAAILLHRTRTAHLPVFDGPPLIGVRPLRVAPAGPPRWPNAGFRNIGRGTKGG